MNQSLRHKIPGKPRILVAPLDWGLGHATRCIPIIRELVAQDCDVWLAGEGNQEQLLKSEFPELTFLPLTGYRINYAKTAIGLIWKMIQQSPKIQQAIRAEHSWLGKTVSQYSFDAIISDNRYGLYHASVPSAFITHQLAIKSSLGKWTEKILQQKNYTYINKFSECWIPDMEEDNNLAGELSHPEKKPTTPVHYIGLLSRFEKKQPEESSVEKTTNQHHLLIILSGPEPQRTLLEEKIITDISHYDGTATIVRGLPGSSSLVPSTNMLQFHNHLSAAELNAAMLQADYVISRSGYSTVMDIMALQKKSILIPTPGQTEQEYLGRYLMDKKMILCCKQENFSLQHSLKAAKDFQYELPAINTSGLLKKTIETFLHQSPKPALG